MSKDVDAYNALLDIAKELRDRLALSDEQVAAALRDVAIYFDPTGEA